MGRKDLVIMTVAALGVASLVGCTGNSAGPSREAGVNWGSCDRWLAELNEFKDFSGVGEVDKDMAARLECATVDVPVDYSAPDGETLSLAISRLLPETESARTVFMNPGGPGIAGRSMPIMIAQSKMSDLAADSTFIGIDVRGTGDSTTVSCPDLAAIEGATGQDQLRAITQGNTACVEKAPKFFENLTTQTVAKDFDRVRDLLGEPTVDYYGVSWGTELGAVYLNEFPERVNRILLDSVTDLRLSAEGSLADVVAAELSFGEPVSPDDLGDELVIDEEAVEGEHPEGEGTLPEDLDVEKFTDFVRKQVGNEAKTALTCNAYEGAADPVKVKAYLNNRVEKFGATAESLRPAHPLSAGVDASICAGWPFAPKQSVFSVTSDVELQLVGHATERATPVVWAEHAHDLLGGELFVMQDDMHGSLANSDYAAAAVEFFTKGTPIT